MTALHIYWPSLFNPLAALLLAPLLLGITNSARAWCRGEAGYRAWQPYLSLWQTCRKQTVTTPTASWLFTLAPVLQLAVLVTVVLLMPFGSHPGFLSFGGDFLFLVALLSLARFSLLLAAFDSGSAVASLGAVRKGMINMFAEPALLLGLATIAHVAHAQVSVPPTPILVDSPLSDAEHPAKASIQPAFRVSLTHIYSLLSYRSWQQHGFVLALVASAFVLVLLSENAKIPVDDLTQPEELTLIHSATVMDYAGLDLAILHYNDSLKLWVFSTLLLGMVTPVHTSFLIDVSTASLAMLVLAILLGILEARWMRWPLEQGHRLALGALLLAALALALEYGYGI